MADGEKLGCATEYTAVLHYRGGERVYTYLDTVASASWGRQRRKVSEASVELVKADVDSMCLAKLGDVWPWTHELTLYRDGRLVWQGPVLGRTETRDRITLAAFDPGKWLEFRMLRRGSKHSGADLSTIAEAAVVSALSADDPNVIDHIQARPSGTTADHTIAAYSRMGADELSEIAGQGMDWTFVGRALFLSAPSDADTPPQARITSADFVGDVELELAGEDYASLVYAAPQAQDGVWQHVEAIGGRSPYFGLVEYVVQTTLSYNLNDDGDFEPQGEDGLDQAETEAALRRAAQSRHTQVSRPPIVLRCPDNARLSSTAPISINRLVPGARIDLALGPEFVWRTARPMRLVSVGGEWGPDGEQIKVSMVQIGSPDEENEVVEA